MKKVIFNWLAAVLAWLLLFPDGRAPTQVRIQAVQRAWQPPRRISRERARMSHHCIPPGDVLPWAGGSWYCPVCRTWRTYLPLPLPRIEATVPHYIPRIRGRHNGHLRYTSGVLVDTGKVFVPGRR